MPWVPEDADRHIKGLAATQREAWARMANHVYKRR